MLKINLDQGWEYLESDLLNHSGFFGQLQWKPVDLPHDASIEKERKAENPSGANEGYTAGCNIYYKKELIINDEWKGKSLILEFEGVMGITEVFINDKLVAKHVNGYTSFLVDITKYVNANDKNTILVHVKNSHKPSSRWYAGTGIYRHVWLSIGGEVYIKPWNLHVTTTSIENDSATLEIKTCLVNKVEQNKNGKLVLEIFSQEKKVISKYIKPFTVESKQEKIINYDIKLTPFIYWDIDNPYLYTIKATIYNEKEEIEDTALSTFGIRTISADSIEGFKLNGKVIKLKGGCIHHDHGILGVASYDRAEERKVELLKSAGYNAIRLAHNPYAPALLEACDRLGMLVIEEFFDVWSAGKVNYDYHLFFEEHWEEDLESTVIRDYNHPSIVMWSIGNEITWGAGAVYEDEDNIYSLTKWCEKLSNKVKELDKIRLTIASIPSFMFELTERSFIKDGNFMLFEMKSSFNPDNDKWGKITERFFNNLDVAGYNYKVDRYEFDKTKYPNRVICGTETHPYTLYKNWKETIKNSNVIGDFVWTAFDYLGEAGIGRVFIGMEGMKGFFGEFPWLVANCGDIDICGEKRPQSYYRDIVWGLRNKPFLAVLPPEYYDKQLIGLSWSWEPVESSYTFVGQEGKPIRVFVYSDADEVELFVNGKSAGRKKCSEVVQYKTSFDIAYEPGALEVVAYKNGVEVGRDKLVTADKPVSIKLLPDRNVISSSYGDLCFVRILALDKDRNIVPYVDNNIELEVEGEGKLVAVGNANPISTDIFTSNKSKLYKGKALAVIKSMGKKGEIKIRCKSENLKEAEIVVKCE